MAMQAPLETEALMRANLRTREELEAWVESQKKQLLSEKREDEAQAQENARQANDAQRRREALQHQHQQLAVGLQEQEREVNAHEVEIEVLQAEKAKKEPIVKELFTRNRQEDIRVRELLAESEQLRVQQTRQLEELQRGIDMYQRLGLFFEHSGAGRVVVRFTQVDAQNPSREFSFRMTIDQETDRYIVDRCSETVMALEDLVGELNRSGDLPLFIRSMRRQFKQLA